jgi:hypothetical protein
MKRVPILAAAAALLAMGASAAVAQTDQSIAVPLSDPSRPATLEVSLLNGSVTVTGYDGDEVMIATHGVALEPAPGPEPGEAERAGLHRIPNTSLGLTAEEHDNTVSIAVDWTKRDVSLGIQVPRQTSVRAKTVRGSLSIEGVSGEHELSDVNGDVSAQDIGGSAVVNTTNGDVTVSFTQLADGKAMSFSSFNGDVDVSFPSDLAADLSINAGRGDVLTDFDVDVQPQTPIVEHSGNEDRYRVRLEREVRATVGGGGPAMSFKTFNGDVVIRRR